jgi:hypothetical protein
VLSRLQSAWARWRENRRRYRIDRAVYKAHRDPEAASRAAAAAADNATKTGMFGGPGGI